MSKYSDNMPPSIEQAIGWLYDFIEPGSTMLDFGCSTGYFGSYIKDTKTCQVYGVEISDDRTAAAKVLDGVYSFDLDGNWPDEVYERTYDYLFFGDVIEHLKDPGLVLQKAKKLLSKNGKIFISTPNVAHMSIRLELLGGNFEYEPMGILDTTHLKYFTHRSLGSLVTAAGYDITHFTFTPNDYPDSVIRKLLKTAGVEPTAKFWKLADTPDARAFQFKLVLQPTPRGAAAQTVTLGAERTAEKPEVSRNAAMEELKDQIKQLRSHAKEQAVIIDHHLRHINELEQERSGRLQRVARKVQSTFRRHR